jgi:shikimate dehydrogenase
VARVYLIGDPVAHSLSPAMQNAAFAALGLPHRYELMPVREEDLGAAVERIRRDDVLGANVTIPHKESIARTLDALDETAQRIGAVNTVYKRAGALRGDNTDAGGFGDALRERGVELAGRRVLLLGAGGAARACVEQLMSAGAHVTIANRSAERLRALVGAIPTIVPGAHSYTTLTAVPRSVAGYDVVVNATALGMRGEDALPDIPLAPPLVVVDIVATAVETPLIARARAAGCPSVDGLIMLLHQGVRAFRLWTGLDAPIAAMRAALPRAV